MSLLGITRRQLVAFVGGLSARSAGAGAQVVPGSASNAFPRTSMEISSGIVPADLSIPAGNLLRYGAVGDGVADDSTALETACRVARMGGADAVVLPAGRRFKITRYIEIFSDTTVHLFGTLLLSNRQSGLFANGADNVSVQGFKTGAITDATVKAGYSWNPGKGHIAPAIHLRSCRNVLIQGINVTYVSQGIFISNSAENYVVNAAFSTTQAYPVNNRVSDCSTTFCEWSGIANLSSRSCSLRDNFVYRCGDGGLWMMGAIDGEIVGNQRISPKSEPADCATLGYNKPDKPTTWNDGQGICLQGCQNVLVGGNLVENFWAQGIDIKDACNRILVTGNRVANCENASIIVREGDPGNTAPCQKVTIIGNTISGHGTKQFDLANPAAGAIHSSSCFITEIMNNVVYSYQRTPAINCLGPGIHNAKSFGANPQQSALTVCGNTVDLKSIAYEGDTSDFDFTPTTPGAIVIKGEYTSVKCDANHIRTDRYYFSDRRYNSSPALALDYVSANGSWYPSVASVNNNEISGWGHTAIEVTGLGDMPYSGLSVCGNTIGTPGGHGISLRSTHSANCSGNTVSQPGGAGGHYRAVDIAGLPGRPVTGIVCTANTLTGSWSVGGNSMDYCISIDYAAELNLSNNRLAGGAIGDFQATHISGNLRFEGSTGFPRSGSGSPTGTLVALWRGELYFDESNSSWWVAGAAQSKTWTRLTNGST